MNARLQSAEWRVVLAVDGRPQIAVIHASGRVITYDADSFAQIAGHAGAAIASVLTAAHADAESRIRAAVALELVELEDG